MLFVTQINIYPIKSFDGYTVSSAIVEKRGLQYDRRWMLVDSNGVFLTQRTHPQMALFRALIQDNQLIINDKSNHQTLLTLGLNETSGETMMVEIWDDRCNAALVSPKADSILSAALGLDCKLVKMPDETARRVDEDFNTGTDIVSFADGYPILIAGEASLKDLKNRLDKETKENITMRRFRPNIIFSGGQPYEEDNWAHFRIGDIHFQGVKPCARCVLTTIDPDTGIPASDKEPLATLSTYRKRNRKIYFGQNAIWNDKKWSWAMPPEICVNDILTV
ncbi:MAG: hypothetical protein RLZZ628_1386 [Bacteroidota bacterium]|jgi:uncharacterized protein YcbX